MLYDIKTIVSRSSATILQDLAGGVGLVVVLVGGLYLPGLF